MGAHEWRLGYFVDISIAIEKMKWVLMNGD
jgi:hypothetical protein